MGGEEFLPAATTTCVLRRRRFRLAGAKHGGQRKLRRRQVVRLNGGSDGAGSGGVPERSFNLHDLFFKYRKTQGLVDIEIAFAPKNYCGGHNVA
jgi:hypothetical protein